MIFQGGGGGGGGGGEGSRLDTPMFPDIIIESVSSKRYTLACAPIADSSHNTSQSALFAKGVAMR